MTTSTPESGKNRKHPTLAEAIRNAAINNDRELVHVLTMLGAIEAGLADSLERILDKNDADPDRQPGDNFWRPLHRAARLGDSLSIKLLLAHGADSRLPNGPTGTDALHEAVLALSPACVTLLVDRGCKPTSATYLSLVETPAENAWRAEQCMWALLEHHEAAGDIGAEALEHTVKTGCSRMADTLLQQGATLTEEALRALPDAPVEIVRHVLTDEKHVTMIRELIRTEQTQGTYLGNTAWAGTPDTVDLILRAVKPDVREMWNAVYLRLGHGEAWGAEDKRATGWRTVLDRLKAEAELD